MYTYIYIYICIYYIYIYIYIYLRVPDHLLARGQAPVPGVALHAAPAEAVRVDLDAEDLDELPELVVGALRAQPVHAAQRLRREVHLPVIKTIIIAIIIVIVI